MQDTKLTVYVRDRNNVLYNGEAVALSARNVNGNFDILTNHENFVSLLNETLIIHRLNQPNIEIPMNNAILKVKDNRVEVYVGVKR